VFLVTQQHWSQSEVGLVTTIGGLLGLAVQTPIGAAIDETRAKRGAVVLALAVLGIGAAVIFAWPSFWPVAAAGFGSEAEGVDGSTRSNSGLASILAAASVAFPSSDIGGMASSRCNS